MSRKRTIDRDAVLNAAELIIQNEGPAALTIDAVARAAGITKGGVQYCFENKAGLIAAMVSRWWGEFDAEVAEITADNSVAGSIKAHVIATQNLGADGEARRASAMMASLMQAPEQLEANRQWYRQRLDRIDSATEEGKSLRLAFLACEGLFLLRSFNFLVVSEDEWESMFQDVLNRMLP
ncbi:TetR family transcriptional regulator [Azorhizobium oxalatiphilum]|uniref:TetR family transcriptional regulator n=1 Tax=Azorhizobium oxalatiphilum TaxID=980631 RepID=A0A917C1J9_9HYPH|nr:TetR/AcrR family transcriptional regulator [Azorhizobium oxalatiphilum]GGF67888.1 TetR family transcriptional regulator [Azorhizobium oxalatiphilum]